MISGAEELVLIKNKLKEMLVRDLSLVGVNPLEIADNEPLFGEGLGLDSLDAVELVVLLQRHFGIEITNMEQGVEVFRTIETMSTFIHSHRKYS